MYKSDEAVVAIKSTPSKENENFNKEKNAEKMLKEINDKWTADFKLIQGIVSATIKKNKKDQSQVFSLYDDRDVVQWEWVEGNITSKLEDNKLRIEDKPINPWSK